MSIQALPGYVVLEPHELSNKMASGFEIPNDVKERPLAGKVVSIGKSAKNDFGTIVDCPENVKKGSVIIHKKYKDQEIMISGTEFRLVHFSDLIATVTEK